MGIAHKNIQHKKAIKQQIPAESLNTEKAMAPNTAKLAPLHMRMNKLKERIFLFYLILSNLRILKNAQNHQIKIKSNYIKLYQIISNYIKLNQIKSN